jgi:hypothetical protein
MAKVLDLLSDYLIQKGSARIANLGGLCIHPKGGRRGIFWLWYCFYFLSNSISVKVDLTNEYGVQAIGGCFGDLINYSIRGLYTFQDKKI